MYQTIRTPASSVFAVFCCLLTASTNLIAQGIPGIPEPGLLVYGSIKRMDSTPVTSGEVAWTITSGASAIVVKSQITVVNGQGNYIAQIPFETRLVSSTSLSATSNTLELKSTATSYNRSVTVNGVNATIASSSRGTLGSFTFGTADRGMVERVDLTLGDVVSTNRFHSADYRDPRWVIDTTEMNRVLSYWRAGTYQVNSVGVDGYAPGPGSIGTPHSADYRDLRWVIDTTEMNRVLSYWRAGGYHPDLQGADGYAPGSPTTVASASANSQAKPIVRRSLGPTITHQATANYSPGTTLIVTNSFSYSGQLLSLLWRSKLPEGWTLLSATTTSGTVETASGEIVWLGAMPPSPITLAYMVQVSPQANGTKEIHAEVEYQLNGSVNPVTATASPNGLIVSAPGGSNPSITPMKDVSGKNIILSWPGKVSGFVIEVSDTLTKPSWTPVSISPVGIGDNNSVIVPLSAVTKFYRLRKQ